MRKQNTVRRLDFNTYGTKWPCFWILFNAVKRSGTVYPSTSNDFRVQLASDMVLEQAIPPILCLILKFKIVVSDRVKEFTKSLNKNTVCFS
ncbi:hypothetical protein TNIN_398321 [Trichonephila inaurata madagascariensis]|uniref:Uncharacterized protein n=1 Tax=Trichonephila inaurata madagascariensis TaxID=2747483 RepID=A0A8X7CIL3_9ARAC|nr:hypothetical protein TNIN_398321 [Trichonephila inaurata madagascariensis]